MATTEQITQAQNIFVQDAARVRTLTSGDASQSYKADDGTEVPSARKFFSQWEDTLSSLPANTKVYPTLAKAQAAAPGLPADSAVLVYNDPAQANNGLYDWNGATLIKSALQPASGAALVELAAELLQQQSVLDQAQAQLGPLAQGLLVQTTVHDDDGRKYPLAVTDMVRILAGFLSDGGLRLRDMLVQPEGGMTLDQAGRTFLWQLSDGLKFGAFRLVYCDTGLHVLDLAGRSALTITRKGRVIIPWLLTEEPEAVGPQPLTVPQACRFVGNFRRRAVNHVIVFGQSLSRGSTSAEPISVVQPWANITLKGGVLARASDAEYNTTAFKPLVEEVLPSSGSNAESPTSGLCNGLVSRLVAAGESASDWVMLGTSSGNGGTTVETLTDVWLPRLKTLITDTAALCARDGLSYGVMAHAYFQGEANYSGSEAGPARNAYNYDERAVDMHEQLTRHVMETTGQTWAPWFMTYQCGAHRRYGRDQMYVAQQQWRSSRLHDWHLLAVPDYILPRFTDNLHLTAEGYWLMGQYCARALYHTVYQQAGRWRPLEPIDVAWSDGHIDVKYHVPCKPLQLDAALCAAVANAGFVIRAGDDSVLPLVSGVELLGDDALRISLSGAAPADATLTCGRGLPTDPKLAGPVGGPRSNVRDSHGLYDSVVSPLGNTFALHNPSVMFEFNRKSGF